jgi:hypothetical protein
MWLSFATDFEMKNLKYATVFFATNFAEKTFVGHDLVVKGEQERERNEIEPVTQMTSHSLVLLATFLSMPPFPVP